MMDVLKERTKKTRFGNMLAGIVAMDDVLGLLMFSMALALIGLWTGSNGVAQPLINMVYEIGGAIILGGAVGFIAAKLLDRIKPGQPVLVESLAIILLVGGIAIYLHVSFLLSAMVLGAVVVNVADETADHLHEIEFIEQPFLVLFFIIAGSTLNFEAGAIIMNILMMFVGFRIVGRYLGGWLVPKRFITSKQKSGLGIALLPQAGVAMGMALVASNAYPETADIVIPVAISATVIFEIFGPMVTARVMTRMEKHEGS
jgi:Kef-type K+ transport system membrane component KefB